MNECKVIDCKNMERLSIKCKLPFIHINDKGSCTDFSVDMDYLRVTLRAEVKVFAPDFNSADPETEHHTPSEIAGEKEKELCQE